MDRYIDNSTNKKIDGQAIKSRKDKPIDKWTKMVDRKWTKKQKMDNWINGQKDKPTNVTMKKRF